MPLYELQNDRAVVDRSLWFPHKFTVPSKGESPFSDAFSRGLYTKSHELTEWLNDRYIPAVVEINAAFSGSDASTRQEQTAESLASALRLLDPVHVPDEARDVALVATKEYAERLYGALYFILSWNIPLINIEHRACALSAAMRRRPFSTMSPDDVRHKSTFDAAAGLVVAYVKLRLNEAPSQGKRWLPWTVPAAGSGGTDRKMAISVALSLANTCRWSSDIEYFDAQAKAWCALPLPETEVRAKLAEWMANCYEQRKSQVERISVE